MKKTAILASGNGSGFEAIYKAILNNVLDLSIEVLISNNTDAKALEKAKSYGIDHYIINKNYTYGFENENIALEAILNKYNVDYIFLSGYMKMIPVSLVKNFDKKIINSHPSLLPKYGGKGMYGRFVHEAVIKNNEKETGVTVHFVNEAYDEGEIILQKKVDVSKSDDAASLERKVKECEQIAIVEALKLIV